MPTCKWPYSLQQHCVCGASRVERTGKPHRYDWTCGRTRKPLTGSSAGAAFITEMRCDTRWTKQSTIRKKNSDCCRAVNARTSNTMTGGKGARRRSSFMDLSVLVQDGETRRSRTLVVRSRRWRVSTSHLALKFGNWDTGR
jgi:hypothetical protein